MISFLLLSLTVLTPPVQDVPKADKETPMITIRREQMEAMGRGSFIRRIAEMLLASQPVEADTDLRLLRAKIAETLDEAEQHGIQSERLMGMYVILRISDKVDPYAIPRYAAVLQDPELTEADKAHLIQMMRIGEL